MIKLRIIHKDCEIELAEDKKLPINSYLVSYILNEKVVHDIVQSNSQVEIFDHYYDEYGNVLKNISWTSGTINPKLYGQEKPKKKIK
jgi:hypothetical protein